MFPSPRLVFFAISIISIGALSPLSPAKAPSSKECKRTAQLLRNVKKTELQSTYSLAVAKCTNTIDPVVRAQCLQSAKDELASGLEETTAQYQARLELCDQLGGGPYDPSIVPAQFVSGISHPFFPHVVGTVRTYQKTTIEGTETVVVEVTDQTKTILGVECMVIRDTVTLNGVLVEDTLDYFAQDVNGNVWYFGELAINYENGEMVDLDGSFIAGTNGAKAGIVMKASPAIGDTYRQEFFLNEAEDAATILSLTGTAVVPFGTYQNCLVTLDFTPISPEDEENKYYAQGIGVVLEIDLESGERLELIDIVQR